MDFCQADSTAFASKRKAAESYEVTYFEILSVVTFGVVTVLPSLEPLSHLINLLIQGGLGQHLKNNLIFWFNDRPMLVHMQAGK